MRRTEECEVCGLMYYTTAEVGAHRWIAHKIRGRSPKAIREREHLARPKCPTCGRVIPRPPRIPPSPHTP